MCFGASARKHPIATSPGDPRALRNPPSTSPKPSARCAFYREFPRKDAKAQRTDSSLRLCVFARNLLSSNGLVSHHLPYIFLETHPIRITYLQDPRANQIPGIVLQALVPDGRNLHLHWPSRKVKLNVQLSIG